MSLVQSLSTEGFAYKLLLYTLCYRFYRLPLTIGHRSQRINHWLDVMYKNYRWITFPQSGFRHCLCVHRLVEFTLYILRRYPTKIDSWPLHSSQISAPDSVFTAASARDSPEDGFGSGVVPRGVSVLFPRKSIPHQAPRHPEQQRGRWGWGGLWMDTSQTRPGPEPKMDRGEYKNQM